MKARLRFVFFTVLIHIFLFSTFRILNFLYYHGIYNSLNLKDIIIAFTDGLRFDISIFFTFSGIFFLLLLIPLNYRLWYKVLIVPVVLLFNLYLILLSTDLLFFGNVKRHLSDEIMLMKNDVGFIFSYLKGDYFLITLIIALVLANIFIIKKIFSWMEKRLIPENLSSTLVIKSSALTLLFLVISIFAIRGTPLGRPINVIDAFTQGSNQYGNLVLNGVFTAYHTSRAHKKTQKDYFPDMEAFDKSSSYLLESYETIPDKNFPLTRKIKDTSRNKETDYNVVLILLESWSAEFIDSFSHKGFGVTPNIDKIYKKSLVFDNFYANGQRSIIGIASTLLSIPQVNGLPYLGKGLEVSNIFRVANHFNKRGYNTLAVQSSARRSFRVSSITRALGFNEFYGKEDIPVVYPYTAKETPNFGWDYDTLEFTFNKIDSYEKPFFSFVFTGTTHEKFILPHEKFEKYPHHPNQINGFLNTLYYSDYSIGEFFKKAEKKKWFKNTLFLITADHCVGKFQKNSIEQKFRIPLMIYAPDIIKPGICHNLGSQVDIIPTILDLTGSSASYAGIGKSLLRESEKRFAVLNQGKILTLISDSGEISSIDKKIIASRAKNKKDIDKMKEILFSVDQSIYKLVKNNRFYNF